MIRVDGGGPACSTVVTQAINVQITKVDSSACNQTRLRSKACLLLFSDAHLPLFAIVTLLHGRLLDAQAMNHLRLSNVDLAFTQSLNERLISINWRARETK